MTDGAPTRELRVCADAREAAIQSALIFSAEAQAAIRERGRFCALLSGGSAPKGLYEILSRTPLEWERIHLFWGDERPVPPEDPYSNFGMARDALLSRIAIPQANIHRAHGELDPGPAARLYESEMRAFFPGAASYPRFDLAIQGLGLDGHTASLFPGSRTEIDSPSWVIAPFVEKLGEFRISVSLGVINSARLVLFLATGPGKAEIVRRVLAPLPSHRGLLPAQRVRPRDGRTVWILDAASASGIHELRAPA